MRAYLSDPRRSVQALIAGVPFGIAMGLSAKLGGAGWAGAGFIATSGIPFGLIMGPWASRWRRERAQAEAGLATDKLRAARRAASRGPVPADPEVREAAIRIASHQLANILRHRIFRMLLGGVMLLATVGAAAAGSLWALVYGLAAAGSLYFHGYWPRQLKRRIELLSAPDTPSA